MKSKTHILKTSITMQIPGGNSDTLLMENTEKGSAGFHVGFAKRKDDYTKKILVADDDPAIIDVLTLMLEAAGYKVYASADWHTITDVNKISPDLILLDILMSGINGHDICKQLKNQPSTKHIPIIMISASKDAKEIASNACAEDFIAKPFEMHKLLQKIAKYIRA